MALNYPGPHELEILYTVGSNQHKMRLNFDSGAILTVGTPFTSINVLRRAAATSVLSTVTDAWVALIKPLWLAADTTFDSANCYQYVADSFEKIWISAYTIGVAATGVGSRLDSWMFSYSFRTAEGGGMRWMGMEPAGSQSDCVDFSSLVAAEQAVVNFILSSSNWILARDTSYPLAFTRACGGQNEAIFRRNHRS